MNIIKIIKRKADESGKPPTAVAPELTSDAAKLRRDATDAINGWINDWRGRKQSNPRTAFEELFKHSAV